MIEIGRKGKANEPFIPAEQHDTLRHEIVSLLDGEEFTAREISAAIGIPEKDVCAHLEHIQMHKRDLHLLITPAVCRKCGFVFRKRERLKKPGRCPVCRGELISEPLFSIKR